MKSTICVSLLRWAAFSAAIAILPTDYAQATAFNYGDYSVPASNISFLDVSESSGTDAIALFGPPSTFSVGLDFSPTNFFAAASNGSADITDGQLNFMIEAAPNSALAGLMFSEGGLFSLTGSGTATTRVSAGMSISVEVLEVDYQPLASSFDVLLNTSVAYNLVSDSGVDQIWQLNLSTDLDAELMSRSINFDHGVTKVSVVLDNGLLAFSEAASGASISKQGFTVTVDEVVPEPTTALLALLGLAATTTLRRK